MKWRGLSVAVLALSLLAAACGGGDDDSAPQSGATGEKVNLKFWVFEEGGVGTFLETVVKKFEQANPNIDLKVTAYPEDQYGVKVDTSLAAGKPPDLTLVFGPDQMRQGLLLPLDDMVKKENIDLSTFSQAIVKGPSDFSCAWDGKLYCLGSYQGAVMMFYNKDLFAAAGIAQPASWPPMTVEQFGDAACKLRNKDAGVWGAAFGETILPWEMSVSPDGRTAAGYINSPATAHQYDVLSGIVRNGCAPTANVIDPWEQGADFFARRQVAMVVTDFQSLSKIEKAGVNYGVTAIPTPQGVEPYFDVWTDSVGVFKATKHPEEAKRFIGYLATEGERIRVETTGDIPLDSKVAEQVNWAGGSPGRGEALEILKHARPAVWIPNKWDAWGPFYDAWGLMVGGEKSAQDALNDAAPAIQENLDKAWKNWDKQG
jgi:multiple sugar transport system substrate-binding protein